LTKNTRRKIVGKHAKLKLVIQGSQMLKIQPFFFSEIVFFAFNLSPGGVKKAQDHSALFLEENLKTVFPLSC